MITNREYIFVALCLLFATLLFFCISKHVEKNENCYEYFSSEPYTIVVHKCSDILYGVENTD